MNIQNLSDKQIEQFLYKITACEKYIESLQSHTSLASLRLAGLTALHKAILVEENKETLQELKAILGKRFQEPSAMSEALVAQLANRWSRIAGSFLAYTEFPGDPSDLDCIGAIGNPINQLCLDIAETLFPLPALPPVSKRLPGLKDLPKNPQASMVLERNNELQNRRPYELKREAEIKAREAALQAREEAINQLSEREGPYFLLMPTLQAYMHNAGSENIHSLNLHEFKLSGDNQTYVPVHRAFVQRMADNEGLFRRQTFSDAELEAFYNPKPQIEAFAEDKEEKETTVRFILPSELKEAKEEKHEENAHLSHVPKTIDPYKMPLCKTEVDRLVHHSELTENCQKNFEKLQKSKKDDNSLYGWLARLGDDAYAGSKAGKGEGKGSEQDAGADAMTGVLNFSLMWRTLSGERKKALYKKYGGDNDIGELRYIIKHSVEREDIRAGNLSTVYCTQILYEYHIKPFLDKYKEDLEKELMDSNEGLGAAVESQKTEWAKESIQWLAEAFQAFKREAIPFKVKLSNDPEHLAPLLGYCNTLPEDKLRPILAGEPTVLFYIIKHFPTCPVSKVKASMGEERFRECINQAYFDGVTPLISAITRKLVDFAMAILPDSNIEMETLTGRTALHWAVTMQNPTIINALLERNADVTKRIKEALDDNPLDIAIEQQFKSADLLPLLKKVLGLSLDLQKECFKKVMNYEEEAPYNNVLEYAIAKHPSIVLDLLQSEEFKASTQETKEVLLDFFGGVHGFVAAAEVDNRPLLSVFLALGQNVNGQDFRGNTALHWAALKGSPSSMQFLLEKNARFDIPNKKNVMVLDIIRGNKHDLSMLFPLLKKIACLPLEMQENYMQKLGLNCTSVLGYWSQDPMAQARKHLDTIYLKQILDLPGLIPQQPEERNKLIEETNFYFSQAVEDADLPFMVTLVDHAGVNVFDLLPPLRCTALHIAIREKKLPAVEWLIEKNWETLLCTDSHEQSTFEAALLMWDGPVKQSIIEIMLKKMATRDLASQKAFLAKIDGGKYISILAYVHEKMHALTKDILRVKGLHADTLSGQAALCQKALFLAIDMHDWPLFSSLVERGADVNMQDGDGNTPLMRAVASNQEFMINLLLKKDANLCPRKLTGLKANVFDLALDKNPEALPALMGKLFASPQYDSPEGAATDIREECFAKMSADQYIRIVASVIMNHPSFITTALAHNGFRGLLPIQLRMLKLDFPDAYNKMLTAPGIEKFIAGTRQKAVVQIDKAFNYLNIINFDRKLKDITDKRNRLTADGPYKKEHQVLTSLIEGMEEAKRDFLLKDYVLSDEASQMKLLDTLVSAFDTAKAALKGKHHNPGSKLAYLASKTVTLGFYELNTNTVDMLRAFKKDLQATAALQKGQANAASGKINQGASPF